MKNISNMKASHTIRVEDKNYHTWHRGIENYGFWAVLIKQDAWLEAFEYARNHVAHLILPSYLRRPHITLSACGLIDEKHFSHQKLEQQITAIQNLNLSPFHIQQNGLDSFQTAPYIAIQANSSLTIIREKLQHIHQDNPASQYHPHLTLGFFNQAHAIPTVKQALMACQLPSTPPLLVDSIAYCSYQTKEIQGLLNISVELPLSSKPSN